MKIAIIGQQGFSSDERALARTLVFTEILLHKGRI